MTYPFVDECLYSTQLEQLLATAPIIEEFGRLGGNFHNGYGSYMNLFFVTVIWKQFIVKDFDHYVSCRVWSLS